MEMMKLANLFEKKLFSVISKQLKGSFDPLKDCFYEGQNAKRLCIRRLI